jgi:putative tryptophan/tyrosine transport system substrate-binding protein
MERRTFLAMVSGSLLAAPLTAEAQPAGKVHRIAWISTEAQPDPFVDGFREGLRQYGYIDGQNLFLDLRYARGDLDALRAAVVELTQSKVAFIVSSGPATRAIKETRDIPVLFAISGDPVELGLAVSLRRPGGNFTGLTFLSLTIAGKRVELLKQAVPRLRRLLYCQTPITPVSVPSGRPPRRRREPSDSR